MMPFICAMCGEPVRYIGDVFAGSERLTHHTEEFVSSDHTAAKEMLDLDHTPVMKHTNVLDHMFFNKPDIDDYEWIR